MSEFGFCKCLWKNSSVNVSLCGCGKDEQRRMHIDKGVMFFVHFLSSRFMFACLFCVRSERMQSFLRDSCYLDVFFFLSWRASELISRNVILKSLREVNLSTSCSGSTKRSSSVSVTAPTHRAVRGWYTVAVMAPHSITLDLKWSSEWVWVTCVILVFTSACEVAVRMAVSVNPPFWSKLKYLKWSGLSCAQRMKGKHVHQLRPWSLVFTGSEWIMLKFGA